MRLATFFDGIEKLGVLVGDDEVADISASAGLGEIDMTAALDAGKDFLDYARTALKTAPRRAVAEVRLMAPVPRPRKILAVGLNYLDHIAEAEEHGIKIPEVPLVFNKQVTSVAGPYDDIHLPKVSDNLDYEGEFAIVIGKRCRHVKKADAASVIAGFIVVNDVSVRDWQLAAQTFTVGKSFDTHCPMGPALVTLDETGVDPDMDLKLWVNGELRQQARTSNLKFKSGDIVEYLSAAMTLEPGDVIPTGTPGGVAAAMKPPQWLKLDDVIRVSVDGLGTIENRVVAEPEGFTSTAQPAR